MDSYTDVPVAFPMYDSVTGAGSNTEYHAIELAQFMPTGAYLAGSNPECNGGNGATGCLVATFSGVGAVVGVGHRVSTTPRSRDRVHEHRHRRLVHGSGRRQHQRRHVRHPVVASTRPAAGAPDTVTNLGDAGRAGGRAMYPQTPDALRRVYERAINRGDLAAAAMVAARICAKCLYADCAASRRRSCARGRAVAAS